MTAADYNHTKKLELIKDVLITIFPLSNGINNVILEAPKKASFTIPFVGAIENRFEIVWDNNLNFEVLELKNKRVQKLPIRSSQWFRVRDLLRKRFLDAEKLKS